MITSRQHRHIEEKAYAFDHNYTYYSLVAGEPFLINDSLFAYFDGKKLSVHLIELEPGRSRSCLCRLLSQLYTRLNPKAVVIWGPDPVEQIAPPNGWERHVLAESGKYRRDMALLLDSFNPKRVPDLKTARAYAAKNRIDITAQNRKQFSAEHILLLQDMVRRSKPDIFDRVFYAAVAPWLVSSRNLVFEARQEGTLMGFIILDLSIRTLPMMMIGAYRRKPPVFSDLLYDAIIRYCIDKGYEKVVMGHSYTEGQYRYKQKWGETVVQPGTWEIILTESSSDIGPYNYPWLARALREPED